MVLLALIAAVLPPSWQFLNEVVFFEPMSDVTLIDDGLDKFLEGALFSRALALCLCALNERRYGPFLPLEDNLASKASFWCLVIIILHLCPGNLLPGIEILEVVVDEVVEDEGCAL